MPFLVGDTIVARVDLKADRKTGRLLVQAAHLEPGADGPAATDALSSALGEMGRWLTLDQVVVGERGDLAAELGKRVSAG